VLDSFGVEVAAGERRAIDLRAILRPLLDLVEITIVRDERIIGLFIGPVALGPIFLFEPVALLNS
jgi:hypothetical protein